MAAVVEELTEGQNASFTSQSGSRVRVFAVSGVAEPEDAVAASGIPAIGTAYSVTYWYLKCASVDAAQMGRDDLYKVTATYSYQFDQGKPKDPSAGTEYWTLDLSGQNTNKRTAYTQKKFGKKVRDVGLLVGVSDDGSVEGVDVLVPHAQLTVNTWKTPLSVDSAFILGCIDLVGHVNTATFYGFSAGEVLFAGVRIVNKGDRLYELEFSFQIQRNETEAQLPKFKDWVDDTEITITGGKEGWEYLWINPAEKDVAGSRTASVKGVYLAKVYRHSSFTPLGLSGVL